MATEQAQRFIDALHRLEEQGEVDEMVSMYSEQAELSNPTDDEPHRGPKGARDFWSAYRSSFEEIHSEFRNVCASDQAVMLEWTSRGRLAGGGEVRYDGVSVVEYQDGSVRRFRAYFDPSHLAQQVTRSQR